MLQPAESWISRIEIFLLASLVLIFVYLFTMLYATAAAREAVRALFRGNLALVFPGGLGVYPAIM